MHPLGPPLASSHRPTRHTTLATLASPCRGYLGRLRSRDKGRLTLSRCTRRGGRPATERNGLRNRRRQRCVLSAGHWGTHRNLDKRLATPGEAHVLGRRAQLAQILPHPPIIPLSIPLSVGADRNDPPAWAYRCCPLKRVFGTSWRPRDWLVRGRPPGARGSPTRCAPQLQWTRISTSAPERWSHPTCSCTCHREAREDG